MTVKVVRKLLEFNFEEEGASVHLVSKKGNGGAANGHTTLIMKSNSTKDLPDVNKISEVSIEKKLEQIRVSMSMEVFLKKFFNMYSDDAELLTSMLGFQTEFEAYMNKQKEEGSDSYSYMEEHQNYIKEQLSSFELMKSLHDGTAKEVSALDLIGVLEIQTTIEKQLEEEMMDKITIEKSRFADLEQIEANAINLKTQNETLTGEIASLKEEIATIKKAKQDAEIEAQASELVGLVEAGEEQAIAKSLILMDKDSAAMVLKSLKGKATDKKVEESELLIEKGHSEGEKTLTKEEELDLQLEKSLQTI